MRALGAVAGLWIGRGVTKLGFIGHYEGGLVESQADNQVSIFEAAGRSLGCGVWFGSDEFVAPGPYFAGFM